MMVILPGFATLGDIVGQREGKIEKLRFLGLAVLERKITFYECLLSSGGNGRFHKHLDVSLLPKKNKCRG